MKRNAELRVASRGKAIASMSTMNAVGQRSVIIGSALLALVGIGCQGQVPGTPGQDPDGVSASFEQGIATSWFVDGVVVTDVRNLAGTLVASAEWAIQEREGRIETGQQSVVARLPPDTALTMELANLTTYNVWAAQTPAETADEIPYVECERCTSSCCSCNNGEYCCVTEWCYDRELGTFNARIDCGGTCGGGGTGGGGECAFGGCNGASCPWNCE